MEVTETKPKVRMIPARKRVGNTLTKHEVKKLRVAAYCRVSTDTDEQATSYEAQVSHYTEYINQHSGWELAGIYADDGISGTNVKKREEFKRMIDDCMAGNIDMVITKSISRFARNTVDCLQYIRELKERNIPIIFEKENINTMDSKGEILITIMSSLAQQESQSLSQNVKLGYQFRFQQGKITVNCNWFLGYTRDKDGKLVIVPEEAEVVKRIYREYLEGKSTAAIAAGLEKDGILTGARRKKWYGTTVEKILKNEKYIGDAMLQKTYTTDCLTKRRVVNDGIVPQYYVENNHEAIIPRQLFMQVQEELQRRAHLRTEDGKTKRVYSSKYALSSIVYCGKCGDLFRRVAWKARGASYNKWRCASRIEKGPKEGCNAEAISETEIQNAVVRAINKTLGGREQFLVQLQNNIEDVLNGDSTATLEYIDQRMAELQEKLVMCVNKNAEYEVIANEIDALREKKAAVVTKDAEQEMLRNPLNLHLR